MTYSSNKSSKNNAKIRREREAQERQSSILDAARHVFFTKGISKATMDDVASEAAVAKGTVYLYYASKEALVAALTLEGLNLLDRVLAEAFAEGEWISAEERLKRLSVAYLNFCQHEPNYFRLIMAYDRGGFRASVSSEIYEQVLTASMEVMMWTTRAIQQGMETGEFRQGLPKYLTGMAWAALNGVLVWFQHPLRRELVGTRPEELYNGVLDMILSQLKDPPTKNS